MKENKPNPIDWGQGDRNNNNGWGQGADNNGGNGWGSTHKRPRPPRPPKK